MAELSAVSSQKVYRDRTADCLKLADGDESADSTLGNQPVESSTSFFQTADSAEATPRARGTALG